MTISRRLDVNLDELDQIIDRSTRAPLSEAEGQKLKTALHAMAERLLRSAPAGHGRNSAAAFRGANRVAIAHATLRS